MKKIFAPSAKLLDHLDFLLKFTLVAGLLLPSPLLIAYLLLSGNDLARGIEPVALITLVLALLGYYLLTGMYVSLNTAITALAKAIERFSSGDLAAHLHVSSRDQLGHVAQRFNDMRKNLKRMIARVSGGAVMVSDAAGKLTEKAHQVTQMAQQQTDSASSVAAAVEEMSTSIAMVARNASDAEGQSAKASDISVEGEKVVREASSEMSRIAAAFGQSAKEISSLSHRTEEINSIVHVIKEIADQTNLLALNAAIEAARAGEQGRGFAVVADEVRKLAERTGKATEEITGMIGNIQASMKSAVSSMDAGSAQVQQGVALASRAGDTLSEINSSSREVLTMVHDIANAVQEQTVASHQIAENIERISTMAEHSSVSMEQMSGEAENLGKVSGTLKEAISLFSGGTANDAQQLVEKGVALLAAKGREKAFAEFADPAGAFIKRDLYLFVYNLQGKVLAHGGNPSLVGKSMIDSRDANGKLFIKERIDIANAQGSGWQDYMFNNPESNVVESKTSYIRKVDDMIIGCGVYK
ncbi:MAG: cache domain-containing protein [Betaproteobacteria bacterium]|nr:cache domain-containing protein [Betaproteobacteria bacterium]